MTFTDYIKANKHFVTYSILTVGLTISLIFNAKTLPQSKFQLQPTPTPQVTKNYTNKTTKVGGITPVSCHATLANKADLLSSEPDATCTPGATNPAVTQATIWTTICKTGYSTTIRNEKPESYFGHLKVIGIKDYGYTNTTIHLYEEDHLISLELGGSNDPANLWPQYGASPNEKDKVENYLHKQVCAGLTPLATAQKEISTDWYKVYIAMPK